jgi:FkbM family methyltransferase
MNIKSRSRVRNKLSRIVLRLYKRLESENNGVFQTNGEARFVREFVRDMKRRGGQFVVFDVGANTGAYSDMIFKEVGDANKLDVHPWVHAFEPVANYKSHGVFNRVAVSDNNGKMAIFKRRSDDLSSAYRMEYLDRKHGTTEIIEIPTVRLDTYMKNNNVSHIDLLKVDVEGHEMAVLKGLGEKLDPKIVSYIQFEYSSAYFDARVRLHDVYRLLESRGYKVARIFPHSIELTPYRQELENFSAANHIAIGAV